MTSATAPVKVPPHAWLALIRAYAKLLDVRVRFSAPVLDKAEQRRGRFHEHPLGVFWFSRPLREVRVLAHHMKLGRQILHHETGPMIPHEVTHVVWPGRVPQDPEEEWESGMISFELAWMSKLAPVVAPAYAETMLSELRNYAEDGRPHAEFLIKAERLARSRVARAHLPNPWEAS